jgi:hypothetical protein
VFLCVAGASQRCGLCLTAFEPVMYNKKCAAICVRPHHEPFSVQAHASKSDLTMPDNDADEEPQQHCRQVTLLDVLDVGPVRSKVLIKLRSDAARLYQTCRTIRSQVRKHLSDHSFAIIERAQRCLQRPA